MNKNLTPSYRFKQGSSYLQLFLTSIHSKSNHIQHRLTYGFIISQSRRQVNSLLSLFGKCNCLITSALTHKAQQELCNLVSSFLGLKHRSKISSQPTLLIGPIFHCEQTNYTQIFLIEKNKAATKTITLEQIHHSSHSKQEAFEPSHLSEPEI